MKNSFRIVTGGIALLGAAVPGAALAADAGADSGADAEIVVTATGVPQERDQTGLSISVIDRKTIETRQTVSIADLLATTPGVALSRNGGPGGVTSLFVRGAGSDQLLVLVDGVRVNDVASPTGAYDFGNIQTGSVESVEILRGSNSVIWGSQALAGVVNIITPQPPKDGWMARANAEYGSEETGQASGTVGYATGPLRASVGGAWYSTAGISATRADNERDNNDQYQLNGRLEVALTDRIGVDLRGFQSRSYVELDGFNPTSVTHQTNGYAGVHGDLLDGALKLRADYAISSIRRDYSSAFGPSRFTGRSERAEGRADWQVVAPLLVTVGAESEWTEGNNSFLTVPQRTQMTSVFGQLRISPLAGLTVTGGVRHDDHRQFGGETTFGGNVAWRIGGTVLRANYAEGFKAPALDELFADYGNTALTPERSRNIDFGIEQHLMNERVTARLTYFDRVTRDQIVFFSCSTNPNPLCNDGRNSFGFGSYYLNVARTTADGVEAELDVRPVDTLALSLNYTYLNARARSGANDGKQLNRRPRDTFNGSLDWTPGPFSLGATVSLVGAAFDNAANTVRLRSYVLTTIRAGVTLNERLSLYGRIENLFDQDYETATGYRTWGRAAFVGIRAKL